MYWSHVKQLGRLCPQHISLVVVVPVGGPAPCPFFCFFFFDLLVYVDFAFLLVFFLRVGPGFLFLVEISLFCFVCVR